MDTRLDKKHPLDDFFAGATQRCTGFFRSCGSRLCSVEDAYCQRCLEEKNVQEFKLEFAKNFEQRKAPGVLMSWYMIWTFVGESVGEFFICLSCGDRRPQARYGVVGPGGFLIPVAVCCTNPNGCKLAAEFWGGNCQFANDALANYAFNLRSRIDAKLTTLRDLRAYRS
jgi:hypothetical protein